MRWLCSWATKGKIMNDYQNGLNMGLFPIIKEISCYNHNYHRGFNNDLLFAQSNDDNTTEWWLIKNGTFYFLGETYTTEGEILHRMKAQST